MSILQRIFGFQSLKHENWILRQPLSGTLSYKAWGYAVLCDPEYLQTSCHSPALSTSLIFTDASYKRGRKAWSTRDTLGGTRSLRRRNSVPQQGTSGVSSMNTLASAFHAVHPSVVERMSGHSNPILTVAMRKLPWENKFWGCFSNLVILSNDNTKVLKFSPLVTNK